MDSSSVSPYSLADTLWLFKRLPLKVTLSKENYLEVVGCGREYWEARCVERLGVSVYECLGVSVYECPAYECECCLGWFACVVLLLHTASFTCSRLGDLWHLFPLYVLNVQFFGGLHLDAVNISAIWLIVLCGDFSCWSMEVSANSSYHF